MVKASNAKWVTRNQIEMTKFVNCREPVTFTDAWRLKPSGGMPVWQMIS
jgi:hypothetical protein